MVKAGVLQEPGDANSRAGFRGTMENLEILIF